MIIALVWLYFAFSASVLFNEFNKPKATAEPGASIDSTVLVEEMSESAKLGKGLFKSNCASCHDKKMTTDLTGPALKGVKERWENYPKEDLYNWIRNSAKLIEARHPRAVEVAREWNNSLMNSMEHLSEEDITHLIEYIER